MAKAKQEAKQAPVSTHEALESESEGSTAVPHEKPPNRLVAPLAPTNLVGPSSRDAVGKLRVLLQAAQYQPATVANVRAAAANVPTKNLHPLVASYKAEVLCYLDGKIAKQVQP